MFIDTHCHLNMMVKKTFDVQLREDDISCIARIVDEAASAGVSKIVNVGTSQTETYNAIAIAQRFSSVFATAGIHPCDCRADWRKDFAAIIQLAFDKEKNRIVAIGETGLDFYHKPFDKQRQIDAFKAHIELSLKTDLPLVIHVRHAADETLRVLEEYCTEIKGVQHCFMQDLDFARQLLAWGLFIGLDAPIGYPKNEQLRCVIAQVPLERIVLETDSPFLPPQQYRGKQNSPKYIPLIAQELADIKDVSLAEIERLTTCNAQNLFNI